MFGSCKCSPRSSPNAFTTVLATCNRNFINQQKAPASLLAPGQDMGVPHLQKIHYRTVSAAEAFALNRCSNARPTSAYRRHRHENRGVDEASPLVPLSPCRHFRFQLLLGQGLGSPQVVVLDAFFQVVRKILQRTTTSRRLPLSDSK